MTVRKLLEFLKNMPPDLEVMLHSEERDFPFFPLEEVSLESVRFCENPDAPEEEPFTDEECVVLKGDY